MRFQVGRFTCEMSLDGDGGVQTRWFLRGGRQTEPPKYLDAADRRQYRAGRDAFLGAAGKLPARLPAGSNWRALRWLAPALRVAATLTKPSLARQNQPQTCIYNGSNIGGSTGGTMSCR